MDVAIGRVVANMVSQAKYNTDIAAATANMVSQAKYDADIAAFTACGKYGKSTASFYPNEQKAGVCKCLVPSACGRGNDKYFNPAVKKARLGMLSTSDDDNINGEAVEITPTSSAVNVDSDDQTDLKTTILNLKIGLAVVSTLLATGILYTLHQSSLSTRAAGQAVQGNPATTADNANDDGVGPESYASITEI